MPSADGEEIADCFFVPTRFVSWTSFASLFSRRITGEVKSGNRFGAKNHDANFRVSSVVIGQIQPGKPDGRGSQPISALVSRRSRP